jgi:hypothetical protein
MRNLSRKGQDMKHIDRIRSGLVPVFCDRTIYFQHLFQLADCVPPAHSCLKMRCIDFRPYFFTRMQREQPAHIMRLLNPASPFR